MPQQKVYLPLPLPTDGVRPEISKVDMPTNIVTDAENWIYRDGRLRIRDGYATLGGVLSGRPVGFANWFDHATPASPTPVLVAATTSKYYLWNQSGQSWTDLSGSLTGDETTHNIMRVYQKSTAAGTVTTMYGCNGKDKNKKYVYGDASVSNMGGSGTDTVPIATAMMVLADRMILGNLKTNASYAGVVGPQCVSVSASQDPTTGYGTVLEDQLADTPGAIVAMMEMGNLQGAIYKEDAIYVATAGTDTVPFTFALRCVAPGPVSPRAVVRINDSLHIYLAKNGDVMAFNGVTAEPMGRHLQRYVLNKWNALLSNRANGWYDHENNEVIIAFPDISTADCTRAIMMRIENSPPSLWPWRWNQMKISAGIRAMIPGGIKYSDMSGVAPYHVGSDDKIGSLTLPLYDYDSLGTSLLIGDADTSYIMKQSGNTDNGGVISAIIESGLSSFATPNHWKAVQYLDMIFAPTGATQQLAVTLLGTNYGEEDDTATSSSAVIDLNASGFHRSNHRFACRRIAYRLQCDATTPVELQAAYLSYTTQGMR